MVRTFFLSISDRPEKKYMIDEPDNPYFKTVYFGATGYSDYTIHKDTMRKKLYELRHRKNENWGKSGMDTPGFFSRWLLWNLPSLEDSIKDTEKRFDIKIIT